MKIFDLIGIGFGPANLALAVAMQEQAETITSPLLNLLFLEAKTEFAWHPGMLLENMSIQRFSDPAESSKSLYFPELSQEQGTLKRIYQSPNFLPNSPRN
jgi:hypothetical protein